MRLANLAGSAAIITGPAGSERATDVAALSEGRFGPALRDVYADWDAFTRWYGSLDTASMEGALVSRRELAAPSPEPRQVFAVGLNFDEHAAESGFVSPSDLPPVFTKYVSSFTGPDTEVVLPEGKVDWEVELVAVIGRAGHDIAEADAWNHVAGLTIGQDLSERVAQLRGPAPQFGLYKSHPGFSPQGPWLVTPDEFADRDDLELGCAIDGEVVQQGRTREMIFPVARLVAELSRVVTLLPGDVIFTGTPAGVGMGRSPQRYLQPGESLRTWIEGIGELHQRFVGGTAR